MDLIKNFPAKLLNPFNRWIINHWEPDLGTPWERPRMAFDVIGAESYNRRRDEYEGRYDVFDNDGGYLSGPGEAFEMYRDPGYRDPMRPNEQPVGLGRRVWERTSFGDPNEELLRNVLWGIAPDPYDIGMKRRPGTNMNVVPYREPMTFQGPEVSPHLGGAGAQLNPRTRWYEWDDVHGWVKDPDPDGWRSKARGAVPREARKFLPKHDQDRPFDQVREYQELERSQGAHWSPEGRLTKLPEWTTMIGPGREKTIQQAYGETGPMMAPSILKTPVSETMDAWDKNPLPEPPRTVIHEIPSLHSEMTKTEPHPYADDIPRNADGTPAGRDPRWDTPAVYAHQHGSGFTRRGSEPTAEKKKAAPPPSEATMLDVYGF